MLLLVSMDDDLDIHGDPDAVWRPWAARELRSRPVHSGHHQAKRRRTSSPWRSWSSSG
jgi:haloacetate dehalogenase